MVLGLAFISWDETLGLVTNFKYPKHLDLTPDLMNKIRMAHSLSESKGEELFEHEFNNQIIISYCRSIFQNFFDEDFYLNKDKIKKY